MPPRSPMTTKFPPPPKRAPAPTTANPAFPKTPATGAARYSKYTPNEKPWSTGKDDAQTRTNAYKAWEQMKHGTGSQTEYRRPPPVNTTKTSRPPFFSYGRDTSNEVPKDYAAGSRTAWEQFVETQAQSRAGRAGMSRSNTTRVPKRNGFAPATPGGDEPQARNTSAYFVSRGGRPQAPRAETQYPPPPGPPPAGKTSVPPTPDYLKSFQSPKTTDAFANSDRLSTPYATAGGERTYFSSGGLGSNDLSRSASLRSNKASAGPSSGFPPNMNSPRSPGFSSRHHSASPHMRKPRPPQSFSSSSDTSSDEEDDAPNYSSTNRASTDHRSTAQRSADEGGRHYRSARAEEDNDADDDLSRSRSRSARDPNDVNGTNISHKQYTNSQPSSQKASDSEGPEGFLKHRMKRDAERGNLPASPLHATAPWNSQNQHPLEKSRSWQEKYGSKEDGNNQRNFERPSESGTGGDRPMYATEHSSFPYIPHIDSLHNAFSNPWKTPWISSGSSSYRPVLPQMPLKHQAKGQCSYNIQSHWSQAQLLLMVSKSPNADTHENCSFAGSADKKSSPAPPVRSPSADNINMKFSPSNWHGQFTGSGDHIWGTSPPKGQPRAQNPTNGNPQPGLPIGQEDPNRTSQMPPPPEVPIPAKTPNQAKFSQEEWKQHFKEPTFAFPPPPTPIPRAGTPKRSKAPRKPSVNQKRPVVPKPASVSVPIDDAEEEEEEEIAYKTTGNVLESEASQVSSSGSSMDIDPALTPPNPESQRDGIVNPEVNNLPGSAGLPTTPHKGENPKSDTDSPHLNLGNLQKVAPLAPNDSGLKDLNDLSTALPFESRPSNQPTKPFTPRRLELPSPPKAPSVPEKLTQSAWEYYIAHMRAYMLEWNTFSTQMLAHFLSRQAEVEAKLGHDWISSIGDDGYARYMRGVEEDFRVREHWDVSWEKHRECMRALGTVRMKAAKGKLSFLAL